MYDVYVHASQSVAVSIEHANDESLLVVLFGSKCI